MAATVLERLVWRAIWPSWHDDEAAHALAAMRDAPPGAVTLFTRHLPDLATTADLNRSILKASDGATRIAVDEEGGPVRRLPPPFPAFPAATTWASTAVTAANLAAHAANLGQRLAALGFAIDFAPVADLGFDAEHPALKGRCFGTNATDAAPWVAAMVQGLTAAGVNACVKHFPGHGAVPVDSHVALATLDADVPTVRSREWPTFVAGIAAGANIAMTGHFHWPALDPTGPTTFSRPLLAALRTELGFNGVVTSDDLEMGAIAKHWPGPEAALLALLAGHDAVLFCHRFEAAADAVATITREAERSPALRAQLSASAARIAKLRQVPTAPTAGAVATASAPAPWGTA